MSKETEQAVENLSNLNIVKVYESKKKLFIYNFLIGMSRGLGTVFGATIFVTIIIFFLSKIQWIPFIGEFVREIIRYLESAAPQAR